MQLMHNRFGSLSINWLSASGLTVKHKRYQFSAHNYDVKNNLWLKSVSYAVVGRLHVCFQRFMTVHVPDELATVLAELRS